MQFMAQTINLRATLEQMSGADSRLLGGRVIIVVAVAFAVDLVIVIAKTSRSTIRTHYAIDLHATATAHAATRSR